jgi:D-alanyl-D-alanine dipeptidase
VEGLARVNRRTSFPFQILSGPDLCSVILFRVMIRTRSLFFLFLLAGYFAVASAPRAQTASAPSQTLLPGPKPPDVPAEWKRYLGVYRYDSYNKKSVPVTLFEENQRLYLLWPAAKPDEVRIENGNLLVPESSGRVWVYSYADTHDGEPSSFHYLTESFVRTDGEAGSASAYRVTPPEPIESLREKALRLSPPEEPGPFRKPELVELSTLDASIHLDIRYASSNNFLGTPVYTEARAFLQMPAALALRKVAEKLKPLGYGLLIHDAYRPWYVTKIFWDATPASGKIFVADPQKGSKHNRGCAVDLTLYDLATGQPVEMPGLYDEMSPRSFPTFPGGTSLQRWHRDLLRRAMESEGFTVNESEWWHFDYKDWKSYPILNVPFEKLTSAHALS